MSSFSFYSKAYFPLKIFVSTLQNKCSWKRPWISLVRVEITVGRFRMNKIVRVQRSVEDRAQFLHNRREQPWTEKRSWLLWVWSPQMQSTVRLDNGRRKFYSTSNGKENSETLVTEKFSIVISKYSWNCSRVRNEFKVICNPCHFLEKNIETKLRFIEHESCIVFSRDC